MVPSWRSSLGSWEEPSCWKSSTSWIFGLFTNRPVLSAAACCVFHTFLKKQAVFWFNMSPKALDLFAQLEVLSQTVLIPSMGKNFVEADWFLGISHIPTLFLRYSVLNHIQLLNSNILFIVYQRKKLPTLFSL